MQLSRLSKSQSEKSDTVLLEKVVFPGEIMDEKLSYKEFLDRNDTWAMDDRDLCFESQPVFKPMEMADPFSMHRGENLPDLAFPADMKNVQLFTDHVDTSTGIHAPHGSMMVPEQPFLGSPYCPAEVLDPSAFVGLDSAAEFLQDNTVPPTVTEAKKPNLPESPAAVTPDFVPTAITASPEGAEATDASKDAQCAPASDVTSISAEKAGSILAGDTKPPQAADAEFAPAAEAEPPQALDVGFAPAPEAKPPNGIDAMFAPVADTGLNPAADSKSHHAVDLEFAPAADAGFAPAADMKSHHAMDLAFSPVADTESQHAVDLEFAPPAEANHLHAVDSGFAPVAEAKPFPAVDLGFVSASEAKPVPAADIKLAASEELITSESSAEHGKSPFREPPAEAPASMEQELKGPEACVDLPLEKAKDSVPSPSHHEDRLPEQTNHLPEPAVPVEAKEVVALENKDLLAEKPVTVDVTVTEKPKEQAEHNHIEHAQPQQEKALQEPTGLPTAQIRQANKSSDRRFGRAKPAAVPIADVPEERLVGLPQQKSTDPRVDPCSVAEPGSVAGASPRTRVSHKKATEQPSGVLPELVESCRDAPRESWDLEGSLAVVKKKKKKPKQKRNQPPRAAEFWDENSAVSRAPKNSPVGGELQKPDVGPVMPAEARKEQSVASGNRASDVPKDAKIMTGSPNLADENAFSVPAPGQQVQKTNVPFESPKNRDFIPKEDVRDESWMSSSKGKRKQVPLKQGGETKPGEPVTAEVPTKPMERNVPGKNERRESDEAGCAGLQASLSEAISVSKVKTPLEVKPSETLLSDKDKEAQRVSPQHKTARDAVPRERQPSSGSLEEAAKKGGSCEKGKGVENESFKEPPAGAVAPSNQHPDKPAAAEETKPVSPDKCMAVDLSEFVVPDSDAALVADKPRKRSSDGKRKKSEKSSSGQPAGLDTRVEATNVPSKEKVAGKTKEMTFDKDKASDLEREALLENLTGVAKEVLEKPETEGGDRKSSSNQPVLAGHKTETAEPETASTKETWPGTEERKMNKSEALPPMGPEMEYGMEEMDFVDENRNIKAFPISPQMLWDNKGNYSESFAQAAVRGPDDTGNVSSGFPKHAERGTGAKELPSPEVTAEKSSKEPGPSAQEGVQNLKAPEQPANLRHEEPGKEVSKKENDKTEGTASQGGVEAGKALPLDPSVKEDIKSKQDEVCLSPVAKADDKEVRTTDKKQITDSTSSDLPQKVADAKHRPAPLGAKGTEKLEETVSFGEKDAAIPESKADAATSQVVEALAEKKAEEVGLDGGRNSEQGSAMCLGSLDKKAAEAEAVGVNLAAAQTTQVSPEGNSEAHPHPAEEDAAHLQDGPAQEAGGDKDAIKENEEESEQKAEKEAKKERVKATGQLKSYMRPTKSRGVPTLPARSAAQDQERQRQLRATGMSRQRQEKDRVRSPDAPT
ncbi:Microtubule-associated protein 4 isoform X2 [Aix galericulata]|nr:Microtubule-associated protein 4 isoform X2 [Aix galericulata]